MTEVKTIKGVDEETWSNFKSLAAKNKVKLGPFLKDMIKEYGKKEEGFWKCILEGEKVLSDKEAEAMESCINKKRKEYGFRV